MLLWCYRPQEWECTRSFCGSLVIKSCQQGRRQQNSAMKIKIILQILPPVSGNISEKSSAESLQILLSFLCFDFLHSLKAFTTGSSRLKIEIDRMCHPLNETFPKRTLRRGWAMPEAYSTWRLSLVWKEQVIPWRKQLTFDEFEWREFERCSDKHEQF